jgi:predicted DNA-binding transcriptional regulator AlpA
VISAQLAEVVSSVDDECLLSPRELAEYLRISNSTLQRWRKIGEGPLHVKLSARRVAYRWSTIQAWLQTQTSGMG